MAEADFNARTKAPSQDDIQSVASRIEDLYHSIVAMHDLCGERISNPAPNDESTGTFVLLRALLRGAARDAENCVDMLDPGVKLGYFEGHFGAI